MAVSSGTFDIFTQGQVLGKVKFTGANAVGPQIVMELPNVMFRPNARIGLIQDEWGQLTLAGEVLADPDGSFGTVTHPDTGQTSPVTTAYYVGKGVVSVQLEGESTYRDVGNVPTFEFEPNVTTLTHYSSRHGLRIKDLEVIREKAAALNMVMDEFTYDNLMLVLMGTVATP